MPAGCGVAALNARRVRRVHPAGPGIDASARSIPARPGVGATSRWPNPRPSSAASAARLSETAVAAPSGQPSARDLPAYCVGDMTAAAARAAGFAARSADGDVDDLAAMVIAAYRPGAGAFLHVRGRHAAGDLVGRLAAAGVPARAAEIYDQAPRPIEGRAQALLAVGEPAAVALFSPRSARLFAAQARAEGWPLGAATAVSLSRAADAALDGLGFGHRLVAPTPGRAGMLLALASVPGPAG